MIGYRLYFLNAEGRIEAAHSFEVDGDDTALWIAERLYAACSDTCSSFELWQMGRKLRNGDDAAATPPRALDEAMLARRQDLLVHHEEMIRDSAFHVAKSRQLLAAIERAKRP